MISGLSRRRGDHCRSAAKGELLPYDTDERLKSYLDTNQLHREQMCRAILAADPRFTEVRPRHPRGGPDGGRDVEAVFRGEQTTFGAVGFLNQANDSNEQKRTITKKFDDDLARALEENSKLKSFVFFTNCNLTIGEKSTLIEAAKVKGLFFCEIFDRERLRIALDSPDGFSTRFQYLNIPLSEEEQASFFARWGDDIQSIISTGFERVDSMLNRIVFLQEVDRPLNHLTISFQLDRVYSGDEIGHFRLFCSLYLKEPKHKILAILFGSTDKSNRMRTDTATDFTEQTSGIKHGIGGGRWESYFDPGNPDPDSDTTEKYKCVGSSSAIGRDPVEFISISYSKDSLVRMMPGPLLTDFDDAMYIFFCNKSLADKIESIHIYANGYKLEEHTADDIFTDATTFDPELPVKFDETELGDPWVRIRPSGGSSAFHFRFFDSTPTRLSTPEQVRDSLQDKRN